MTRRGQFIAFTAILLEVVVEQITAHHLDQARRESRRHAAQARRRRGAPLPPQRS